MRKQNQLLQHSYLNFKKKFNKENDYLKRFYDDKFEKIQDLIDEQRLEVIQNAKDIIHLIENQKCFAISNEQKNDLVNILRQLQYQRSFTRNYSNKTPVQNIGIFNVLFGFNKESQLGVNIVRQAKKQKGNKQNYKFILIHFYDNEQYQQPQTVVQISQPEYNKEEFSEQTKFLQNQYQETQSISKSCETKQENYKKIELIPYQEVIVIQEDDCVIQIIDDDDIPQIEKNLNTSEETINNYLLKHKSKSSNEKENNINKTQYYSTEQLNSDWCEKERKEKQDMQKKILELEDQNAQAQIEKRSLEIMLLQAKRQIIQGTLKQKFQIENINKENQKNQINLPQLNQFQDNQLKQQLFQNVQQLSLQKYQFDKMNLSQSQSSMNFDQNLKFDEKNEIENENDSENQIKLNNTESNINDNYNLFQDPYFDTQISYAKQEQDNGFNQKEEFQQMIIE